MPRVRPRLALAAALQFGLGLPVCAAAQSSTPGLVTPGQEATLRGQVVDERTGQPVAGADVSIRYLVGNETSCGTDNCGDAPDDIVPSQQAHQQTTGSDGRFEIKGITPGDYSVTATPLGYVEPPAWRTFDPIPEVIVTVGAGRTITIDLPVQRPGAVSGRVFSDEGDGLAGVEVELLRRAYRPGGGATPMAVGFGQTGELGEFHFPDVAPGEYHVRAYTPPAKRPSGPDTSLVYAPTFYPETTEVDVAQRLLVGSGQELTGIDLSLQTTKRRVVQGQLVDPDDRPLSTATVHLGSPGPMGTMQPAVMAPDGRFRFDGVLPGNYVMTVRDTLSDRRWTGSWQVLSVRDDVADLVVVASSVALVVGSIAVDDDRSLPPGVSGMSINLQYRPEPGASIGAGGGEVSKDGTFSIQSGAGTVDLLVAGLPSPWHVKTAMLDGVDATHLPLEVKGGARHRLEIVVTDRVGRLSGVVTDRSGRAVPNALVAVFPEDRARWRAPRLVRTVRSHQQGRYGLADLPLGSYRAVAVPTLPARALGDPAVLDRLWSSSVPVQIQEDQPRVVSLQISEAPADLLQ